MIVDDPEIMRHQRALLGDSAIDDNKSYQRVMKLKSGENKSSKRSRKIIPAKPQYGK